MTIGAVLVGLALALFLYNQWDADRAAEASDVIVGEIIEELDDTEQTEAPVVPEDPDQEMTPVFIDGYDYIGYLTIPSLGLCLPVMSEWSYDGLRVAPGRFSGSVYTDDLVIAGHNYARHFSPIKWIEIGAEVNFVDMDHQVWRYEVTAVETLQPTDVEKMSTKTEDDDWDLTLFTCTTGGQSRCTVRCVRMQ